MINNIKKIGLVFRGSSGDPLVENQTSAVYSLIQYGVTLCRTYLEGCGCKWMQGTEVGAGAMQSYGGTSDARD